jgi:hypothetical protein
MNDEEGDVFRDIIAPPKPVLRITYNPEYYSFLRRFGEDHLFTQGTADFCRRICLERHKQALEF